MDNPTPEWIHGIGQRRPEMAAHSTRPWIIGRMRRPRKRPSSSSCPFCWPLFNAIVWPKKKVEGGGRWEERKWKPVERSVSTPAGFNQWSIAEINNRNQVAVGRQTESETERNWMVDDGVVFTPRFTPARNKRAATYSDHAPLPSHAPPLPCHRHLLLPLLLLLLLPAISVW